MGIIKNIFERRSSLANPAEWFVTALGGKASATGISVTPTTALYSTAVYACVKILAETVASLPLPVYRRLERSKERDPSHPLYTLLHDQPNPEMTSFEFREALMGHLALRGNAYAEIVRDGAGKVVELWPLRPDRMQVKRESGKLAYYYAVGTQTVRIGADRIMHLRGLSDDGIIGYSPVRLAREAIGLALATEEFGARFFGNNSRPGGILVHPNKLTDEAKKRLKESWEAAQGGLSNAHRVAVLEEGIKWEQIGIAPEDAQYLETRNFQLAEIARFYRIPGVLVGLDDKTSTYASAEQFFLSFVVHTIRPWLVRWEQAIKRDLFTPSERETHFAEFLVDGLLRGDIQSRYNAYAVGRQNGWLSANDIRRLENMDEIEGGDIYLVPLNMVPANDLIDGSIDAKPGAPTQPARSRIIVPTEERQLRSGLARRRIRRAYARVIEDAAARIIRREKADVLREAEKQLEKRGWQSFDLWLEQFYAEHREFIERNMGPVFRSLAELVQVEAAKEVGGKEGLSPLVESSLRTYLTNYVLYHTHDSLGQIRAVMRQAQEQGQPEIEALQQRLAEWEEKRPGKISTWESVALTEAVAVAVYEENQIQRIRWAAIGSSCPWCRRMDGRVVGIKGYFANKGESVEGEGEGIEPMLVERITRHPPLHLACDCCIAAE